MTIVGVNLQLVNPLRHLGRELALPVGDLDWSLQHVFETAQRRRQVTELLGAVLTN